MTATETTEKAQSGQARRQRRRKEGSPEALGLKLPIPDFVFEKYPKTEFRHRWIRAEKGRMYAKTKADDWDPVEGVDPVPGANDQHGNPVEHVLCVKPLDWWKADRAKREARRKQVEEQFRRGNVAGKGGDAGEQTLEPDQYTGEVAQANRLR